MDLFQEPVDYLEIVKFLNKDLYTKNMPGFNDLLELFETINPSFGSDNLLSSGQNAKIFISYVFIKVNWVIFRLIQEDPDLAQLIDLQMKIQNVRGKYGSPLVNFYLDVLYCLLSVVTLYRSDKSNEALSEFNKALSHIIKYVAEWWQCDSNCEYMIQKAPAYLLTKSVRNMDSSETCSSCGEKISGGGFWGGSPFTVSVTELPVVGEENAPRDNR
jgi:hypothetical protein